jgi:DEAD/DEAH box helicase domain-containing protein
VNKIKNFVEFLRNHPQYSPKIAHVEEISAHEAEFSQLTRPPPTAINHYLRANRIFRLYSHQVEAIEAIRHGRNVVVTTATGSGKTLIYNLSVWEEILKDPKIRALYIFPTKALTQDQLDSIQEFTPFCKDGEINAQIYDGDTSAYQRRKIKKNLPHILLTNPDMLQMGILPFHSAWKDFLTGLRFVILDELHTYRGIFGTHMAHILRRLKRILEVYGRGPQFIASSATIDTSEEFAQDLTGENFIRVDRDGAPSGRKYFLLWESEASPYTEAAEIFLSCLDQGLKTILFTKARRVTELLISWIKEDRPDLSSKVASYRAGYLPSERRSIEADLFRGKLAGVISTSALELGIDVGALDCCILLGYPGTVISTWQRGGRVGRGQKDALIIMVALDDALDQYFLHHPQDFFARKWEKMIISPKNEPITCEHLPCAAVEHPLSQKDAPVYPENFSLCLDLLEKRGELFRDREGKRWFSRKKYPQRDLNIRSIGETYAIINLKTGKVMGDIDETRLYHECYPGAVYLHRAEEYEILHLNEATRCVYARRRDVDYYTQASSWEKIEIFQSQQKKEVGPLRVLLGKVRVTEQVTGFEKRRKSDRSLISEHLLSLPERSFETISLWLEIPSGLGEKLTTNGVDFAGALHATEHATIAIFPLKVTCDRQDVGGYSFPFHLQTQTAAIFFYDGYPGGVGLVEEAFPIAKDLFQTTLKLIQDCSCERGCPSCCQSPKCGSGNRPLDKRGAILLLGSLLPAKPTVLWQEERQLSPGRREETSPKKVAEASEDIIFFDLETQKSAEEVGGWENKRAMRLSVAVTYNLRKGRFEVFTEDKIGDFLQELLVADLIIGFNIKRFDYAVLSRYTTFDLEKVPTLDILEVVRKRLGFRLSLDHLSQSTLGYGKIGTGLDALRWFREGRMDRLTDYCKHDVKIVRELYEYGKEHGYLLFKDRNERTLRIPVSWK